MINPDLAPPQVIVDFPNNYKAWLEARRNEMEQPQTVASEEEVAQIIEAHEVDGTENNGNVIEATQIPINGVKESDNQQNDELETQIIDMNTSDNSDVATQEFSMVGGSNKRKILDVGLDEPPVKVTRHTDDAFVAAIQQHSDLITVNDADLTTTVVDVVTDSSIPANIEVVAEDGEDDLAAELPDGFYSTSCTFIFF